MFRLDIFGDETANSSWLKGSVQPIVYTSLQLRRLPYTPSAVTKIKSFVVAIPVSVNVDFIMGALKATSALLLEPKTCDALSFKSLLLEQMEEDRIAIATSYHGCEITEGSLLYILPVAEVGFHGSDKSQSQIEGDTIPCCPACLERIDFTLRPETIWFKYNGWSLSTPTLSNCKVCMTVANSFGQVCSQCIETNELQICMICGVIGCGR
eukprot:Blabericola_migrator_1__7608@NODE_388_length_9090_cov_142_959769_g311_i0_p3_GENE_NODE_388_length_9090_cov_142_959769_g311_i0NODE_388_length_9090_cov_142_959769_g311_i0_p3_ORF_typecomplete_len210_score26_99zfUBP/PF02148_19/0_0085DUF2039/PF10217_9/0_023_NODE_388_length_9090_cov_142_959769_g311_i023482977